MRKILFLLVLMAICGSTYAELTFDAGADLRIRQEIYDNVPGMPGGGRMSNYARGPYKNHLRFRPRVWGEVVALTQDETMWRVYTRLADEFRWYVKPTSPRPYAFPDELIIDNLFIEAKGLFDGLLDFRAGRQDLLFLYGLDHIFVDGTPGDGSRSTYTDMIRVALNFEDDRRLDLFALYNFDDSDLRWGTEKGHHRALAGLGGAEPEMDNWGFGAIWNDKIVENVPYQFYVMQKNTASYHLKNGTKRPTTQRELIGLKLTPRLNDEWALQLEADGQIGKNGDSKTLYGAHSYAGANWMSASEGIKPFAKFGYEFKSGSKDAAKNDGGHGTWDPMWSCGAVESEMFLYGPLYGVGWWSNSHYPKLTLGLSMAKHHRLSASMAPIFAACRDHLGGGDGSFKGLQSQVRYDFPIFEDGRFEVFAHVLAEFFNPGDYYSTDKPAYFVRWQLDFKF